MAEELPRLEVAEFDEVAVAECSLAIQHDTTEAAFSESNGTVMAMETMNLADDGAQTQSPDVNTKQPQSDAELCETEYSVDATGASGAQVRKMRAPNQSPWRCSNSALLLHYVLAGAVQNVTTGTLFGILMGTMAVEGHVYISSRIFVMGPWAFKPIFGFISDCFPLCGFYRKPYCAIGWGLVTVAYTLLLVLFEEPATPKYCVDKGHGDLGNFVVAAGVCNQEAAKDAWLFTVLMAVAMSGLTLAESAADGLLLECAQSWSTMEKRGQIMLQQLVARLVGAIAGSSFLALCFNARRHLGFFEWELSFGVICCGVAVLGLVMVVAWIAHADNDIPETLQRSCTSTSWCCWCCKDGRAQYAHCTQAIYADSLGSDKTAEGGTSHRLYNITSSYCRTALSMIGKIASTLCTRTFAKFTLFEFTFPVFAYITPPALEMMKRYTPGVQVQQLQEQFTDISCYVLFVACLAVFQRAMFRLNWRVLTAVVTIVGVTGVTAVCGLTAYDVVRNQYFYQTHEFFAQLPRAYNYLVATLVTAELAPHGMEASVYGIISSAHSIAPLVGRTVANALYAHLPVIYTDLPLGSFSQASNYVEDSEVFRLTVLLAVATFASMCVLALVLLPLLPVPPFVNQPPLNGSATQEQSNHNRNRCALLATLIALIGLGAAVGTAMAIMPHSSCDAAVGGQGC